MNSLIQRIRNKIHAFRYQLIVSSTNTEDRFSNIYKYKLWFSNKESLSGSGSTLDATSSIRKELPKLLKLLHSSILLDIGCGDFHWMKEVDLPCRYVGVDIVKKLIDINIEKYADSHIEFQYLNPGKDKLPLADIILCREVLFHLSYKDCSEIVDNVLDSGAKYFIVTNNDTVKKNVDIRSGYFRNLNMCLPPFNFPSPRHVLDDSHISKNRTLGVWRIDDLNKLK